MLLKTLIKFAKDHNRPIPRHIHLQMDNTSADNKTQVVLAFFMLLVQAGILEAITLGFLPVGHTHEDMDALFSIIASFLKRHACSTFEQLAEPCVKASAKTEGSILRSDMVFDWIHLIRGHHNKKIFKNMTLAHGFKISHHFTVEGQVGLQYKEWCRQIDWLAITTPFQFKPI